MGSIMFLACGVWAQLSEPQPDQDGVYEVGGAIKMPALIHAVPANYPAKSGHARHISALNLTLGSDGTPLKVEIENARPDPFDEAAVTAVKSSKFEPGTLHEKPVPVHFWVWVPFLTPGQPAIPQMGPFKLDGVPVRVSPPGVEYLKAPKGMRPEGAVLIRTVIDDDGRTKELHISKSLGPAMDEQASKIVETYRFKPATRDGVPVPTTIMCQVTFRPQT
ncbi:MAG TPA: energy transducer TonB [Terracidiphilus sp.]|nr:energy transducer TonB [Terracidiphilus sp.]